MTPSSHLRAAVGAIVRWARRSVPQAATAANESRGSFTGAPDIRWSQACIVALILLFVLFARRYAQMLDPQVWDEEFLIITQAINQGLGSLCIPINGYFILLPRLVSLLALCFPLAEYPRIATILTWGLTIGMLLAVALVPSRLRGGPLLALSALLIPSDAEVFGLPLYIFWWTIPLLFASYFWSPQRYVTAWRIAAIVVSGLSAPTILLAVPAFALKAIVRRTWDDVAPALAAGACAILQLAALATTKTQPTHMTPAFVAPAITKLIGGYFAWNLLAADALRQSFSFGVGIITLLFIAAVFVSEPRLRKTLGVLVYFWLGSIVVTVARMDPVVFDQTLAGPRYFFMAFVVEGWILLQIAFGARRLALRALAVTILLAATFNVLPVLSRTHADLAWKASIQACAASASTAAGAIPVQMDGRHDPHWILWLNGRECRLIGRYGILGLISR